MEILQHVLRGDLEKAALEAMQTGKQIPLDASLSVQAQQIQQQIALAQTQSAQLTFVSEFTNSVFKSKCTFARFTGGGKFIVSGSDDNCVKLLELQKARQDNVIR